MNLSKREEELEAFREAIRVNIKLEHETVERELEAELARQLALERGYSFTRDYVSHVEENWQPLREKFQGRPDVRMLEIGSFEGRSAVWFLENVLTHPSAEMVCIDTFQFGEARFDHNIHISGFAEKVQKLKGSSEELLLSLPLESFDLIYVDGDHHAANVLMDGVLSWYRLKPGGAMIFDDDWMDRLPDSRPRMAIDLFLQLLEGQYDLSLRARGQVVLWKYP